MAYDTLQVTWRDTTRVLYRVHLTRVTYYEHTTRVPYYEQDHTAVFAGSDDGFVAMYDGGLNFEKDWKAEVTEVNLNERCLGMPGGRSTA